MKIAPQKRTEMITGLRKLVRERAVCGAKVKIAPHIARGVDTFRRKLVRILRVCGAIFTLAPLFLAVLTPFPWERVEKPLEVKIDKLSITSKNLMPSLSRF